MLFSKEQSELYVSKIQEYLAGVSAGEDTDYISVVANQSIIFVESKQELQMIDRGGDYFNKARDAIKQSLEGVITIESLENAHFEAAKLLRILSFGGFHDFNESSIVDFYLRPQHSRIKYKKIDKVRFDVPTDFIFDPYRDAIDKTLNHVKEIGAWEDKLVDWKERVEDSENRYKAVIGGNNYLGLANAFSLLLDQARKELGSVFLALVTVGMFALFVPGLYIIIGNSDKLTDFFSGSFGLTSISVFSFSLVFEALLLYYFRIIYAQWRLVKHQILQLSLRHQMCAFASEYASSSQDMDRSTLSKFENLVFSELSQDGNTPPSFYDAADAIAKVFSSIRKP